MTYLVECHLHEFDAWSGGKDTLNVLLRKDDDSEVESIINELFYENTPTDTQINDFLWFERDYIAEQLGYSSWEEYECSE